VKAVLGQIGGPEWLALATAGVALATLVGVLFTLRSQRKRERERWLADRRFEAYSRLSFATSEVGSATGIRGHVWHEPKAEMYMLLDSQAKWERAHQAFNEAQHLAGLIAGKEVAPKIVEVSQCVHDMIEAAERASQKGDIHTGSMSPGDASALTEMEEAEKRLIELRGELVNAARRELGVSKRRRARTNTSSS
jgi:hypothetical protein